MLNESITFSLGRLSSISSADSSLILRLSRPEESTVVVETPSGLVTKLRLSPYDYAALEAIETPGYGTLLKA